MKRNTIIIGVTAALVAGAVIGAAEVQAGKCDVAGCTQISEHEHYVCDVAGCTQTSEHEHYVCEVAGCMQISEHQHQNQNNAHHSENGHGYQHRRHH